MIQVYKANDHIFFLSQMVLNGCRHEHEIFVTDDFSFYTYKPILMPMGSVKKCI
jgi:hypothetical protein